MDFNSKWRDIRNAKLRVKMFGYRDESSNRLGCGIGEFMAVDRSRIDQCDKIAMTEASGSGTKSLN